MVARGTVANILKKYGIEPSPQRNRQTNRKEFLSRHWELMVAADFFTVEVWTRRGLQRLLVLFFIELSTRRVKIAGVDEIARDIGDPIDGLLVGKRYLIHDRDPLFTAEFLEMLAHGEGSLRKVVREFVAHYHLERNHQGLGHQLITPEAIAADSNGTIQRRQRLGGMLNYYHRAA